MPAPNLFIVYVTDVAVSTSFYSKLFRMNPRFTSPRFVEFEVATGAGLALWSGKADSLTSTTGRTSEVCLNLPGGPQVIDGQYQHWCNLGVTIVQEPHDDVFGRTFIAQDPDGNLLRVAPVDPA
ncbi:VOC family protein [Kocuria palustris]|uniref:VOC family protein n=1 Tax=Kocuria palustris TaxID=71999 RepID=UPI003D71F48F